MGQKHAGCLRLDDFLIWICRSGLRSTMTESYYLGTLSSPYGAADVQVESNQQTTTVYSVEIVVVRV